MTEAEQTDQILAMLRMEHEIQKERADKLMALVQYAYNRSSKALMMPPSKPREARKERDQALCDINKKLGGAIR